MDKQKEFLDKVIDHILKKTDIDYDIKQITNWPFYRNGMGFNIFMSAPHSVFGILERHFYFYCKEVYGLTKEESKYVWEGYINMLGETIKLIGGNINESGDKQKNFYNKVLERLLKETVITDSKITFPFANFKQPELSSDSLLSVSTWIDGRWENHKYPGRFKKYCNDIYGVTYEESVILWRRYIEIIEKEILKRLRRNKSNVATIWNMGRHDINESVDKQKEFLDKVLEMLKSETEFKVVKNDVTVGHKYDYYWKYPFSEFTTLLPYYPTNKSSKFHKHCRDIYGLSNEEIEDYILPNYYKWLKDNNPIHRSITINENDMSPLEWEKFSTSTDEEWEKFKSSSKSANDKMKKEREKLGGGKTFFFGDEQFWLSHKQIKFLDKVVEQILRETDIDYEKWRLKYPFFDDATYSFQYTLPFSGPFIRYCKRIYGVTKEELKYVHGMYTGILDSKIRKYYVDNDIYNKYYNVMGTKTIVDPYLR